MNRAKEALEEEHIATRALFEAFDGDKDGRLDAIELKDMLWRLLPGLNADEIRFLLAHFFEHVSLDRAEVSYAEFAAAAVAAGEDPGGKRGTVAFKVFDRAIKALGDPKRDEE